MEDVNKIPKKKSKLLQYLLRTIALNMSVTSSAKYPNHLSKCPEVMLVCNLCKSSTIHFICSIDSMIILIEVWMITNRGYWLLTFKLR